LFFFVLFLPFQSPRAIVDTDVASSFLSLSHSHCLSEPIGGFGSPPSALCCFFDSFSQVRLEAFSLLLLATLTIPYHPPLFFCRRSIIPYPFVVTQGCKLFLFFLRLVRLFAVPLVLHTTNLFFSNHLTLATIVSSLTPPNAYLAPRGKAPPPCWDFLPDFPRVVSNRILFSPLPPAPFLPIFPTDRDPPPLVPFFPPASNTPASPVHSP